ncbi:MAG: asparagine synthase-related protein [Sarcina sp.]
MSGIIWGKFNLKNINKDLEINEQKINEVLATYKFDFTNSSKQKNFYIGCALLNITKENEIEVLPYYDEESGLLITSDSILDNREEIIEKLNLNYLTDITDSFLILESYKKWGDECLLELQGDYSFVIYNTKKNSVFVGKDHVGNRTLYYYFDSEIFVFSTLIEIVRELMGKKPEINKRWCLDFLELQSVCHQSNVRDTLYEEISYMEGGCYGKYQEGKFIIQDYWKPLETIKVQKNLNYKQEFKEIFCNAVFSKMRTTSNIATTLSGGLDSSAVTAIASKKFLEMGKKIYSFTSIPMKDFSKEEDENSVYNEGEYAKLLANFYKNIELTLCDSKEKNSLSNIEENLKIIEQPYKVVGNIFWLKDIIEKASYKSCKILLVGQGGNSTISFGDRDTYIKTKLNSLDFYHIMKEFFYIKKNYQISNKELLGYIKKFFVKKQNTISELDIKNFQKKSIVKDELLKEFEVIESLIRKDLFIIKECKYSWNESRPFIVNKLAFRQLAELETKVGLREGIIIRDPTRDKNIIEFCLSLSIEAFYFNGKGRLLIREAVQDLVPDEIRLNYQKRGVQSSDLIERIKQDKVHFMKLMEYILKSEVSKEYLDLEQINILIEFLTKKDFFYATRNNVTKLISIYTFIKYKETINDSLR